MENNKIKVQENKIIASLHEKDITVCTVKEMDEVLKKQDKINTDSDKYIDIIKRENIPISPNFINIIKNNKQDNNIVRIVGYLCGYIDGYIDS